MVYLIKFHFHAHLLVSFMIQHEWLSQHVSPQFDKSSQGIQIYVLFLSHYTLAKLKQKTDKVTHYPRFC